MEFEDVSAEVQWEMRRITAAFEADESLLTEYQSDDKDGTSVRFNGVEGMLTKDVFLAFTLRQESDELIWSQLYLYRQVDKQFCDLRSSYDLDENGMDRRCWTFTGTGALNELMARALYRLHFDDDTILSQLPQLTAHEKLELRLSTPREFWPKTWVDEEA